jgi:hypothetical protein
MRSAPAVQVVVVPHRGWRAVQSFLYAATAAVVAAWAGARLGWPAVAAAGAAAAVLAWWRTGSESRPLRWDGRQWQLDGVSGAVAVMIDLGAWMLLRFEGTAGAPAAWLALSRAEGAADWHGLRTALYAAAPTPSLPR